MVTEEFKQIIDEDIKKCEEEYKIGDKVSRRKLHTTLISKYSTIIDGFNKNLRTLLYDETGNDTKENIETMRQKLLLFKSMNYQNSYSKDNNGITVNNNLATSINISFPEVKKQIENMSSLPEAEIQEILEKIEELREIVESNERKSKKWDKAKNIILWVLDKGVDVGIAFLPLLLKLGE